LNKLDLIDVLVNNVGTVYRMEYFTKIPVAYNKTYFNVNMLSYTKMIEIILPKMVQQKRGIIINISSQAGERPVPLMTTYSASNYYFFVIFNAITQY
jgi:short-subunit dehydrogenase